MTTATHPASAPRAGTRTAVLHRMEMEGHTCPWGLKTRHLLKSRGFAVDDRPLTSRAAVDAFKAEHGVATTPQIFIDGVRIGGHDDLRRHLGLAVADPKATTYRPVAAVFAMAAALALATSQAAFGTPFTGRALEWAVAFAMALLAMLKLQDVDRFVTAFLGYDLLARRWVPYASLYPWIEGAAGVLMAAGVLTWLSAPLALLAGGVGAASVVKAVFIDKRELKCACVGGNSNVPLGFVSLTENLVMVGMAAWMALWML